MKWEYGQYAAGHEDAAAFLQESPANVGLVDQVVDQNDVGEIVGKIHGRVLMGGVGMQIGRVP